MTKVLIVMNAMTHYFNLIASRINEREGVEIKMVVPGNDSPGIGEGVFQTSNGANFEIIQLEERTEEKEAYLWFPELDKVILSFRPDIVLVGPGHLRCIWERRELIRKTGAKIILKSIPFRVPDLAEARKRFKEELDKNPLPGFSSLPRSFGKVFNILGISRLYKKAVVDRRSVREFESRFEFPAKLYNFPDAHVNYIDDAIGIYGGYGVPARKIFITRNSPDTDLMFSIREEISGMEPVLPPNPYRIVHLSRLVEWKRVDMLITALADLSDDYPGAELLILGDGPEKDRLHEQARKLGVESRVRIEGGVYDPVLLGRYLATCSLYILAGMGGLSINDAMIFGLPVICSVCDGTEKFLVREGYNGTYFESGNQNSLEERIRYLFNHPDLMKKMGENSAAIIRNEVNIHTVVDGYMKAFRFVTGNH
ncbi:MAG: glycosyltransferase family 4 protein [Bacteroidota bacterium]